MKTLGIILAGGKSTRLYPSTLTVTKQLLPIYDKPLVYYPLSILMLVGIKDIVTITTVAEVDNFQKLYSDSELDHAINSFIIPQFQSNGIPEAFNLVSKYFTKEFIESFDVVVLILGDNLFHGATVSGALISGIGEAYEYGNATIFGQKVPDLQRFGVATLADNKSIRTIIEKPSKIDDVKNSYAITGLYVFPTNVFEYAKQLVPSVRGETEIVDLLKIYHNNDNPNVVNTLRMEVLKRGVTWFDTGTPDSLLDAAHYVKTIQHNQGFLVGSPHEIAYRNGWLDKHKLLYYIEKSKNSDYSKKLLQMLEEDNG